VVDECRREAVALVDELLEDRLPLACQDERRGTAATTTTMTAAVDRFI
jgi:hypothetical protein